MKISQPCTVISVNGTFYDGEFPDTLCFVPSALIQGGPLDEGQYVT
jgi:hypothetical protein